MFADVPANTDAGYTVGASGAAPTASLRRRRGLCDPLGYQQCAPLDYRHSPDRRTAGRSGRSSSGHSRPPPRNSNEHATRVFLRSGARRRQRRVRVAGNGAGPARHAAGRRPRHRRRSLHRAYLDADGQWHAGDAAFNPLGGRGDRKYSKFVLGVGDAGSLQAVALETTPTLGAPYLAAYLDANAVWQPGRSLAQGSPTRWHPRVTRRRRSTRFPGTA